GPGRRDRCRAHPARKPGAERRKGAGDWRSWARSMPRPGLPGRCRRPVRVDPGHGAEEPGCGTDLQHLPGLRVAKGGITGRKAKAAAFVAEPQSVQPECQPAAVCLEHRLLRAPESKEVAANVLGAARGEPVRLGGSEEAPRHLECARARAFALAFGSDPRARVKR